MSKCVFITGTGTDIGKTYISGLIVKKLKEYGMNPGYFKTAVSGNDRDAGGKLIPGDPLFVKKISGIEESLEDMCPYVYERAYSPHLAARIEGGPMEIDRIKEGFERVCAQHDYVTMEGSGGILCPIRFDEEKIMLEDIIRMFDLGSIIVADAGLGTINAVVLTVKYMEQAGLKVRGIIYNNYQKDNPMHEDNIFMCEYMTGVKTIAKVAYEAADIDIDEGLLLSMYQ